MLPQGCSAKLLWSISNYCTYTFLVEQVITHDAGPELFLQCAINKALSRSQQSMLNTCFNPLHEPHSLPKGLALEYLVEQENEKYAVKLADRAVHGCHELSFGLSQYARGGGGGYTSLVTGLLCHVP